MAKRDKTDGAVTCVMGLFMFGFNLLLCVPLWGFTKSGRTDQETHLLHCVSVGIVELDADLAAERGQDYRYASEGVAQTTTGGISFHKREALFHVEIAAATKMVQDFQSAAAVVVTAHGIMLVNMFAESPKDIIGWEKNSHDHQAALISFGATVVAYTVVALYVRYGLELPETDPDGFDGEIGVHWFVNGDDETVDYFAPTDGDEPDSMWLNCYSEIPYFEDAPTGRLADIGWIITFVLQMTTVVSLGASYFLTPGREDDEKEYHDTQ